MAPVTQLSEQLRNRIARAQAAPQRREGTAEIHILPCVRREIIASAEPPRAGTSRADCQHAL